MIELIKDLYFYFIVKLDGDVSKTNEEVIIEECKLCLDLKNQ